MYVCIYIYIYIYIYVPDSHLASRASGPDATTPGRSRRRGEPLTRRIAIINNSSYYQ